MIAAADELSELRKKNNRKKIGFAAGTFDVLHIGHVQYLNWAKSQCDILVVYIRSDARVREVKGRQPYNTEKHRALLVDNIKAVDFVVIGGASSTKKPSVEVATSLNPDVILIGSSWAAEEKIWREYLPSAEIRVSYASHIESSTQILSDHDLL